MRTSHILSALAFGAAVAAGGVGLAPAFAQNTQSSPAVEAPAGLSIAQIHQKLVALGYSNIDKIEREGRTIEVRATEPGGARVKLSVDGQAGDIIDTRPSGRKRDRDDNRTAQAGDRIPLDYSQTQTVSSESLGWYLQDIYQRMRTAGM